MKFDDIIKQILNESLDYPYKWSSTFRYEKVTKEDDEGNEYEEEIFTPVQIIHFKTEDDIPYIWYARQNRYNENSWEIAFGVNKGNDIRDSFNLDIKLTGTGRANRIFSTVIEITNHFIELDENYEIRELTLTSDQPNRTKLYLNRILPRIENFKVDKVIKSHGEDQIILHRT